MTFAQPVDLDGPHWPWVLRVYGRPGVSPACLHLQDNYGVDVNVLLIALYAASGRGLPLGPSEISQLDEAAERLRREVVAPLRAIRRLLKPHPFGAAGDELRNRVKKAELAAEQLEQAHLAALLDRMKPPGVAPEEVCHAVLRFYAERHGALGALESDPKAAEAVSLISSAARPMPSA